MKGREGLRELPTTTATTDTRSALQHWLRFSMPVDDGDLHSAENNEEIQTDVFKRVQPMLSDSTNPVRTHTSVPVNNSGWA